MNDGGANRLADRLSPFVRLLQRLPRVWRRVWTATYYRLVLQRLGRRSRIDSPLHILNPQFISIGSDTHLRRGARLEAVMVADRPVPKLCIGDRCFIEQNVQIIAKRSVRIGNDVSVAGHCAIVDVTHPYGLPDGQHNIGQMIQDDEAEVRIDDGCFIGFGSVILPGVHLGSACIVGANSVVTTSFPPRCVVGGIPAKLLKSY